MALEGRGGNEIGYLYHPESFVPLAQVHDGVLHHLHTDHLGTPLEASNEGGDITWRVTYRTWGNVIAEEVTEIQQRVRFQGQYFDAETGLHYNRFRSFDPQLRRYLSQDPIGLYGGINSYPFAPNSINWVDVFGLARDCPCAGSGTPAGKRVNMPAWKSITILMDHIASGHMVGGARLAPGNTKDVFPKDMSRDQVERAVRHAYRCGEVVGSKGGRVLVRGPFGSGKIEMYVNKITKAIESAWPKF